MSVWVLPKFKVKGIPLSVKFPVRLLLIGFAVDSGTRNLKIHVSETSFCVREKYLHQYNILSE